MTGKAHEILILGGGLSGLSAGYTLTRAGHSVKLVEKDHTVGGLSKTVVHGGFRFDLGGHRFFTNDKRTEDFLQDLMAGEMMVVPRKSKILLQNRYLEYPLKPLNAVFGLDKCTQLRILSDYVLERAKTRCKKTNIVSLEDWVVSHFGRTLFNLYFKEYSEKLWGIDCSDLSKEWISQRIKGLSLGAAIKDALFRSNGDKVPTLADKFTYPSKGIGRISERLRGAIEKRNDVLLNTSVVRLSHDGFNIKRATVQNGNRAMTFEGGEVISTIAITDLVQILDPKPPDCVQRAAAKLRYRDMVIVAVMMNRERVTTQNWIYVPEKRFPFGRIHEPVNWSAAMAPEGKTHLVMEHFCFRGDKTWRTKDDELADKAVLSLEKMGLIKGREVIDWAVLRIPKAYPMFEVGYSDHLEKICDYLKGFKNLYLSGRGGMFRYLNMDHAIASGREAAERIMGGPDVMLYRF